MKAVKSLPIPALAATLGMALLFGTSFVASKVALGAFSPTQVVFLRFAVAALFFFLSQRFWTPKTLAPWQLKKVLLLALLEPGAYFVLESYGLKLTLASTASVLIATIPLFVLLGEVLFLRLQLRPLDLALILISLVGVGMLLNAFGVTATWGGTLQGNLLVLGAAVTASAYTLLARKVLASVDALSVTRWQAYFAAVVYGPFAGIAWGQEKNFPTSPEPWLAIAYLGLFCSFGAYFLLNYSLAYLRPSLVAAFSNLIPVVATVLSVLLLGERLSLVQGVGAALTVGAVAALTLRQREQPSLTSG